MGKLVKARHADLAPVPGAGQIPRHLQKVLTRSDRQFLLCYASCRTIKDTGVKWAAMRGIVDRSESTTTSDAYHKLRAIREKIAATGNADDFWEILGLGANSIARALSEGLGATVVKPVVMKKPVVMTYIGADGKERSRVQVEDELVEAGPYPDHQTRVNAAMAAAKLRGDLANSGTSTQEGEDGGGPPRINVTITQYNVQVNNQGGNGKCLPPH